MTGRENAYLRAQQARWMRPDAHRWVRADVLRYIALGSDPVAAFPALDRKYNPAQPRVPAGSTGGGQWTDGGVIGGGNADAAASPMGNVDFGNLPSFSDLFALFQIAPSETDNSDDTQLAGDVPTGDSPELPSSEPPEIPQEKPRTGAGTTGYLRAAANWLGRNTGLAADIYTGFMNNVEWLSDYHDLVKAGRDQPKTFEELQEGVGQRRPGYDDHHIVEQTLAERFGFTRSEIDDPSNLVSIPRLKHYQITGWYSARNPDLDGLSPREYLADKSWDERMKIGRDAMVRFGVLRP